MRKITARDWLALSVPMIVIVVTGIVVGDEKGAFSAIVTATSMLGFSIWIWRRRIRQNPTDTWGARL